MLFWRKKSTPLVETAPSQPLIAVVDDEEDLCCLLELALRPLGYDVAKAHDGASGLDLIRHRRPALVLLDIMMPRMNGYQVLARLQQDPQLSRIPVIVMTSLTGNEGLSDEQWAERLGVVLFISKPVDPEVIAQTVRERVPLASAEK